MDNGIGMMLGGNGRGTIGLGVFNKGGRAYSLYLWFERFVVKDRHRNAVHTFHVGGHNRSQGITTCKDQDREQREASDPPHRTPYCEGRFGSAGFTSFGGTKGAFWFSGTPLAGLAAGVGEGVGVGAGGPTKSGLEVVSTCACNLRRSAWVCPVSGFSVPIFSASSPILVRI